MALSRRNGRIAGTRIAYGVQESMSSTLGEWQAGFGIARWQAWTPAVGDANSGTAEWREWLEGRAHGDPDAQPNVAYLPALLRRRLDRAGRMAVDTAWRCLEGVNSVQVVFGSRHGSFKRTIAMLDVLAREDTVSPSVFSLAVHNSVAGLLSIARGDRGAATALAAGENTLGMCLVEGAGMIAEGAEHVLIVYSEDVVPPPYDELVDTPAVHPFGVSLLLTAGSAPIRCRMQHGVGEPVEAPEAALIRFLIDDADAAVIGVDQSCRLERH